MVLKTIQKARDPSVIYKTETRIASTKQRNVKVTEHSSLMAKLWQEMDLYKKVKLVQVETLKPFFKKERERSNF